MPTKIAFITPLYLPALLSGSEVTVKMLSEELTHGDFDVSVITSNALTARLWYDPFFGKKLSKSFAVINGVKVYRLPCRSYLSSFFFLLNRCFRSFLPQPFAKKLAIWSKGPYLKGLLPLLAKQEFAVIHCSPFPLNLNWQVAAAVRHLKKRPRLILTPLFHGEVAEYYNPQLQTILDEADVIHLLTNFEKEKIKQSFAIPEEKMVVIPLFLDLEKLKDNKELNNRIKDFKEQHRLKNRKIVLFAGNKGPLKGAITLLKIIGRLYLEDSSYLLLTIGQTTKDWEKAKREVDKDCFLDLGFVSTEQKEITFASCDFLCLPSKSEAFGLVYLEAWAKEKAVIAANMGVTREMIASEKAGILVEFGNSEELSLAIVKLANNRVLAKDLGQNGYRAVCNKYSRQKVLKKYLSLYCERKTHLPGHASNSNYHPDVHRGA